MLGDSSRRRSIRRVRRRRRLRSHTGLRGGSGWRVRLGLRVPRRHLRRRGVLRRHLCWAVRGLRSRGFDRDVQQGRGWRGTSADLSRALGLRRRRGVRAAGRSWLHARRRLCNGWLHRRCVLPRWLRGALLLVCGGGSRGDLLDGAPRKRSRLRLPGRHGVRPLWGMRPDPRPELHGGGGLFERALRRRGVLQRGLHRAMPRLRQGRARGGLHARA